MSSVSNGVSRRRFLGLTISLAALSPLLARCDARESTARKGAKDLGIDAFIIANWGGTTSDGMVGSWGKLFTERTGVPVRAVNIDYGKFIAQVDSKRVQWSWIDAEGWFAFAHPELLQQIPYAEIGVTEEDLVDPQLMQPKALASYLWGYVTGYRTDREGDHPRTWEQFFDSKAVPGRRTLFNWPVGAVEIALLGDGVPFDQLYPLDLDRAFDKIDSIREDLIFSNTLAEIQQSLVSGSADFGVAPDTRINYLARGGLPVAVEWNEHLRAKDCHIIPKSVPSMPACIEFLKAALDPDAMGRFALLAGGGIGPPTKTGFNRLDESLKPFVASNPDNAAKAVGWMDDKWWGENIDDVSTKWYEFVGG